MIDMSDQPSDMVDYRVDEHRVVSYNRELTVVKGPHLERFLRKWARKFWGKRGHTYTVSDFE